MATAATRSVSADPAPQVLGVASALLADVDGLDLDAIDRAFYWDCCRPDFAAAVANLRAQLPRIPLDPLVDDVEDARRILEGGVQRLFAEFGVPQQLAIDHVTQDVPAPLRWHAVTSQDGFDPSTREPHDALLLKVASRSWTGRDVEGVLREWEGSPYNQFGTFDGLRLPLRQLEFLDKVAAFLYPPGVRQPAVSIRISFDLVREEASREGPRKVGYSWHAGRFIAPAGDVLPPYVELVVGLPLPPEGTIASLYDAVVRKERKWHLALPRAATRQDKITAIRTWAVGLLVGAGADVRDTMGRVCGGLGLGDVSQTKFMNDRKLLLERVPEAQRFLYAP